MYLENFLGIECFTHWKAVKTQNSYSVFSELQKSLVTTISLLVTERSLCYTSNCAWWIINFTFEEKLLCLFD